MFTSRSLGAVLSLLVLAGLAAAQGKLDNRRAEKKEPKRNESAGILASLVVEPGREVKEVGGRSLERWMADAIHDDPSIRAQALTNIPLFGDAAVTAVPTVLTRMHDGDASPRVKAVMALSVMAIRERDIPKVVEALGQRLAGAPPTIRPDSQAIVRYQAAQTLRRFPQDLHELVPVLARGAVDRDAWEIRHTCVVLLRQAGWTKEKGPDPAATRALLAALDDHASQVKLEAIMGLGAMGRPPEPMLYARVVSALKPFARLTNSPSMASRLLALWAHVSLMALDEKVTDTALDHIVKFYVNAKEREMRVQGLTALGAMGTKAHSRIKDVLYHLDDPEPAVVVAACTTLSRMEDNAPENIEALIRVTRRKGDENRPVILQALVALQQLAADNPAVRQAFVDASKREDLTQEIRRLISDALDQMKTAKKDK
jgi:HEAT repeat protein